jgi:hypothetical protein
MQTLIFAIILAAMAITVRPGSAESIQFEFASMERGRQVLTNRDDFVKRLSPFDRAARVKTDQPVDEAAFLQHVAGSVLPFSASETNTIGAALAKLKAKIEPYQLKWPSILLIKTTGKEEANAPYTRSNAIVIPSDKLAGGDRIETILCHELFHIISRSNPSLKEALYATIGFQKCPEVKIPVGRMRITNPDAPVNDHWIAVKSGGKEFMVVPVLLAKSATYDVKQGGELFDYLDFQLLAFPKLPGAATAQENGILLEVGNVEGFFEQIGMNTGYIIHPEETLAENFVLLVKGARNAKSPEILEKMKKVLETERK